MNCISSITSPKPTYPYSQCFSSVFLHTARTFVQISTKFFLKREELNFLLDLEAQCKTTYCIVYISSIGKDLYIMVSSSDSYMEIEILKAQMFSSVK